MRNNQVVWLSNKKHAMQGKIRQWLVDNPRAMDAAFTLAVGGAVLSGELTTQAAGGAAAGP